MQKGKGVTLI